MKCLNGSCETTAVYRGLCVPCYNAMCRLVSKNTFTWEELIEKKQALPKYWEIEANKKNLSMEISNEM